MTEAFLQLAPHGGPRIPLLVHVPHGSLDVPAPWRNDIVLSESELARELLLMTDAHTEALFHQPPASEGITFTNRQSRLVFDPERFEDDEREPLARLGMGAVYVKTSEGRPLRGPDFSPAMREAILARTFRPYARALGDAVDQLLDRFGRCLIIDGHSFPTHALPYEDQSLERPDVCLGYEDAHAPHALIDEIDRRVREHGLSCSHNTPFAGSYVPLRHYRCEERVFSLMLELRRGLYMDERDGSRSASFERTRSLVRSLLATSVLWLGSVAA